MTINVAEKENEREEMKMKKKKPVIGILTFHCAENYGAFLQAYAMQAWLEKNVESLYDIKMIDYRPRYLIEPYKIKIRERIKNAKGFLNKIKAMIIVCTEVPNKIIKKKNFLKACKKYHLSEESYSDNHFFLDDNYYALILGSDQIWNPNATEGFDQAYFGKVVGEKSKRIAYAASLSIPDLSEKEKEQLNKLLKNLNSIGVREQTSVKLLEPLTEKKVNLNCDPTILIDRKIWENCVSRKQVKKYILVYRLQENQNIFNDAYKIAKKEHWDILHFGDPSIKPMFRDVKVRSCSYCGPIEFINYIYNAEMILTNSFHGTCFSIIFGKEFFAYLQKKGAERLIHLSEAGKFEDRLVPCDTCLNIKKVYKKELSNASDIYENLQELRNMSEYYLIKAIED